MLTRSFLYVPADNERALAKASSLGADVIIIDLEDAVSPGSKTAARVAALTFLESRPANIVALRINGAGTPFHEADIALVRRAKVPFVVLPKVAEARDLDIGVEATIWPMIETPRAILSVGAIAEAAARHASARAHTPALIAGTNDLALELTIRPERDLVRPALSQMVLAARAFGAAPIDGVTNDFRDAERLAAEAADARRLGMAGKTCIHPSQVEPVNRAFTPDEAEVAHARDVIAAMETAQRDGRSVATLNGVMVEELHVVAARRTLAAAGMSEVLQPAGGRTPGGGHT